MKKIDWFRLLGFDQIALDRGSRRDRRIGGKIGGKEGRKFCPGID